MSNNKAAILGDNHQCPQYHQSGNPHQGGKIYSGSQSVLINGKPAAHTASKLFCNGAMCTIASGSASVYIEQKAAARLGDKTSHNGVILGSGSDNVIIGG